MLDRSTKTTYSATAWSPTRPTSMALPLVAGIRSSGPVATSIYALAFSAGASLLSSQGAHAQALEEVVVTAQRKTENLQDIPLSVTSLSEDQLDSMQMLNSIDVSRSVPNMVAANTVGLSTSVLYFLRGVGSTESIATFDLPVGTYIDEVYLSRQNANQVNLSAVERVEILRGPQGTLFGRNTTGGAIHLVTKKPTQEFHGRAEVGYGRFDRISANGMVNIPLSDSSAVMLSAFKVEDDGFMDNQLNSETYNAEDSWGTRAALRWRPTESLTWDISGQYIDAAGTLVGPPGVVDPVTFQPLPIPATGDLQTLRTMEDSCEPSGEPNSWPGQGCQFNRSESSLFISNLAWSTDAGTLNFITGYYDVDHDFNLDILGNTDQPIFGGVFGANFYISNSGNHEQFSQEIKWQSEAFDGRLSYVAGLYYMDEENETRYADTVNLPVGGGVTIPATLAYRSPMENTTENVALYAQGDYAITDQLTLQLGLRYTDEEKTFALEGLSLDFATFSPVPFNSAQMQALGIPLEQQVDEFTPRVALYFDVHEDLMFYASYTEGFKSGGWNARGTSAIEMQNFGPEFVESWEVGMRSDALDGRLRTNATLFRADYSEFQVPSVFPGSSTFLTLNSGDARVDGLELESVFALSESFDVFLNLGLMDAGYEDLTANAVAAGIGPELQRAPDVTAQLGVSSGIPLPGGSMLNFTADVKYTSDFEMSPSNDPEASIDEQTLLNAQLRWTNAADTLSLIAECRNCTDEVWFDQNLFNMLYPAQPLRWNFRVQYRF